MTTHEFHIGDPVFARADHIGTPTPGQVAQIEGDRIAVNLSKHGHIEWFRPSELRLWKARLRHALAPSEPAQIDTAELPQPARSPLPQPAGKSEPAPILWRRDWPDPPAVTPAPTKRRPDPLCDLLATGDYDDEPITAVQLAVATELAALHMFGYRAGMKTTSRCYTENRPVAPKDERFVRLMVSIALLRLTDIWREQDEAKAKELTEFVFEDVMPKGFEPTLGKANKLLDRAASLLGAQHGRIRVLLQAMALFGQLSAAEVADLLQHRV